MRFINDLAWNDFLSPYIQAKAWAQGKNPYSSLDLVESWPSDVPRPAFLEQQANSGELPRKRGIPTPYPVASLVLLWPFTWLSWTHAELLWLAMNAAAAIALIVGLWWFSGVRWHDSRSQIFLAMGFALAPLHTGLATGNPAVLATGLTVAAFLCAETQREISAAVLLGLSVCLKPPIGGCLLIYYLIRRRWRVSLGAAALVVLIGAAGILRLELAGVHWIRAYIINTDAIFARGSLADFTEAGPLRFNLINLQVLAYTFFGKMWITQLVSLAAAAALFSTWIWAASKSRAGYTVLQLSGLFIISLLPMYHRFYDAMLLLFPLCWSVLISGKRPASILISIFIIPFLFPGASVLQSLTNARAFPGSLQDAWLWNTVVMSHEVWSLLCLAVILIYLSVVSVQRGGDLPGERQACNDPRFEVSYRSSV